MPIERDAFFSMLGIAMRAGQLSFGEDGVRKAIATGAAFITAESTASHSRSVISTPFSLVK